MLTIWIDSVKTAAATIAYDLMTYYNGNITGSQNWQGSPGILPLPFATGGYYWWEAGGMWGAMIDYWYYTGDATYNDVVTEGIVFQSNAPANNFMTRNQTLAMVSLASSLHIFNHADKARLDG